MQPEFHYDKVFSCRHLYAFFFNHGGGNHRIFGPGLSMLYSIVGVGLNAMPMAAFQDALTNLMLGDADHEKNPGICLEPNDEHEDLSLLVISHLF